MQREEVAEDFFVHQCEMCMRRGKRDKKEKKKII
jgi:hypothetical protein